MTCRVHLMSGQREVLPDWAEAEGWPGFVNILSFRYLRLY